MENIMTIITETYVPYEFSPPGVIKYIVDRAYSIKHSIRRVEIDKESGHLILRCPLSGDYLEIAGEVEEIEYVDTQLRLRGWYRTT